MSIIKSSALAITFVLSLSCAHRAGKQTEPVKDVTAPQEDDLKARAEAVLDSLEELSQAVSHKVNQKADEIDLQGRISSVQSELEDISSEIGKSARNAEKSTRQELANLLKDMEELVSSMKDSLEEK